MEKYKVYLFTFPNGKKYCGYTSQELNIRWHGGHGYEKCPLVWRAIQKYGWKNIIKEVIFSTDNSQEALDKEKEIIAVYQLTNPEYGYNLDEGGRPHGNQNFLTEEGRERLAEASRQRWQNPQYKAMIIEKMKARPHTKLSEETKQKISNSKKGSIPPNRKQVYQLDKNTHQIIQMFESATAAAIALGINKDGCANILNVCKGKRKSAYGYKWRFVENEEN